MNQEKIGKFIAKLRKKKKMTQEELAYKLGINNRTVSRWENGENMPDYSLIKPLCDELGITINELLSGEKLKKEEYQEKFEENIINTINYSNKKVNEKNNLIGIILITFGIITSITAMSIFPSESNWGSIYSVLGGIISLTGIGNFTKRLNYTKRLIYNFTYFIIFILLLFLIDYISVVNIKKVPIFYYEKTHYDNLIIYEAPFYNVYRINVDTKNEYYIVDTEKKYIKETIPLTPFNREKAGIENIIKYKNKDLNNKTNTENLISDLPLSEYEYSFEIDKEKLGLIINYNATNWEYYISEYLKRSILYNAVSIFVLIDNVDYIDFNIKLPYDNQSFHIKREYVEKLYPNYKYIIQKNIDKYIFNRDLETPINDYYFVVSNFKTLFIDANLKEAKKIEVVSYKEKITGNEIIFEEVVTKTFNKENGLDDVINIFSYYNPLPENASVTAEGNAWTLLIYDKNDKITSTIYVWYSGTFGTSGKQYNIEHNDKDNLISLLSS